MKNTAHTLPPQAGQLLTKVTAALSHLDYADINHQRISHTNDVNALMYQGLSHAQHPRLGHVMVKWVLQNDKDHNNSSTLTNDGIIMAHIGAHQLVPPLLSQHDLPLVLDDQTLTLHAIVMPYYPQGNLAQYLNQPLSHTQKRNALMQAAQLIADVHQCGWLHNDIKPSNVLRHEQQLLLTDFALASKISDKTLSDQTCSKAIAGTPAYLAPERWHGVDATVQSDVYAFGIMMVEMLIGARPFNITAQSGDPMMDWATQHCQQPILELPLEYRHYQRIVNNALAKRTEARYQSMEAVLMGLADL